jgi:pantothenate kinase-related protein Tda10
MGRIEVPVLHGSPGSRKTTLSKVVSEILRAADRSYAVIDLDDLSTIHPDQGRSFARQPQGDPAALCGGSATESLIPSVLADVQERDQLRAAVPGARFVDRAGPPR